MTESRRPPPPPHPTRLILIHLFPPTDALSKVSPSMYSTPLGSLTPPGGNDGERSSPPPDVDVDVDVVVIVDVPSKWDDVGRPIRSCR